MKKYIVLIISVLCCIACTEKKSTVEINEYWPTDSVLTDTLYCYVGVNINADCKMKEYVFGFMPTEEYVKEYCGLNEKEQIKKLYKSFTESESDFPVYSVDSCNSVIYKLFLQNDEPHVFMMSFIDEKGNPEIGKIWVKGINNK